MKRNTIRRDDLEPGVAFTASLAALAAAARFGSAGLRTAVRRTMPVGAKPSPRSRTKSADADRRTTVVRRSAGGDEGFGRRTPGDYLAAAVLAGMTGTIALAALSRSILQQADAAASADAADVPGRGAVRVRPTITGNGLRRSPGGYRPLAALRRIEETQNEIPEVRPARHSSGTAEARPEPAPSGKGSVSRRP